MTSIAISPFTMPAALAAGDSILNNPTWVGDPSNKEQMEFLEGFRRRSSVAEGLSEIESNATQSAKEHVEWLQNRGWKAGISGGSPNDLFLASVLSIGGKWKTKGNPYVSAGVHRAAITSDVLVHERDRTAIIKTNTDVLFMLRQVNKLSRSTDSAIVIDSVETLRTYGIGMTHTFLTLDKCENGEVDFPTAHLETKSTATYMLGLRADNNVVTQASEGFELKMNHIGGLARARAEVAVTRGISMKPRVVIDGPYVVAVFKETIAEPMFLAYVDKDSWKDPGDF